MPRFSRESIKTHYFHVMTQGINKEFIFQEPAEIKLYIKIMYELLKEHNLKIVAYCIMNNHAHLLLYTREIKELSNYMKRLNTKYALYYNKIHNRVGYVFRNRFKSEGIYSQRQFYTCMKYIYDNPVKAGICSNPEDYPYSNYQKIQDKFIDESLTFIDTDDEKEKEYELEIKKMLNQHANSVGSKYNYDDAFKKIVIRLSDKYNLSNRKIAELLGVGREQIRTILQTKN